MYITLCVCMCIYIYGWAMMDPLGFGARQATESPVGRKATKHSATEKLPRTPGFRV